jgi:hypothetical protein
MPQIRKNAEAGQVEYIVLLTLAVLALIPSIGMLTGSVGNHLCIHIQNKFVDGEPPLAQVFGNSELASQLTDIGAVMCLSSSNGTNADELPDPPGEELGNAGDNFL